MAPDLLDDLLDLGPPGIPALMSEPEIAAFLGLTAARVRQLARDGVLVRPERGRFDVRASVAAYTSKLREGASRAGRPSLASNDALKAERLRLTRAQAEAQEQKNRTAAGELVDAAAVTRQWQGVLRDVRAEVLGIPARAGAALSHLSPDDLARLESECRAALERLADGNA